MNYSPLFYSIGDIIEEKYLILNIKEKLKDSIIYLCINKETKNLYDLKIFYKSPKLLRKSIKEIQIFTILNTIDFEHKYFPIFYNSIFKEDLNFLFFENLGPDRKSVV